MIILIVFLVFITGVVTFMAAFTIQSVRKSRLKELQKNNLELQKKLAIKEEENIDLQRKAKDEMQALEEKITGKFKDEAELKTRIENLQQRVSYYKDSKGHTFVERRKFSRLALSVGINYKILGNEAGQEDLGISKNISKEGICVMVNEQVEIGDILSLDINLPGGQGTIHTKGKVKWRNFMGSQDQKSRWDVGCEFVDISDADKELISKYIFVNL